AAWESAAEAAGKLAAEAAGKLAAEAAGKLAAEAASEAGGAALKAGNRAAALYTTVDRHGEIADGINTNDLVFQIPLHSGDFHETAANYIRRVAFAHLRQDQTQRRVHHHLGGNRRQNDFFLVGIRCVRA